MGFTPRGWSVVGTAINAPMALLTLIFNSYANHLTEREGSTRNDL